MDQKTMTMKCFRCGRSHLLLEMVMDGSGKGMVCRPCAGLSPKPGASATPRTAVTPAQSARPTVREQFARPTSPKKSSGKYGCMNCKFRFSSSKALDQISCPYCGSRKISTPDEHSADALLKQAGNREYDF